MVSQAYGGEGSDTFHKSELSMSLRPRGHSFDLPRYRYDLTKKFLCSGICMDKDRSTCSAFIVSL